jgi:hypothetical protein
VHHTSLSNPLTRPDLFGRCRRSPHGSIGVPRLGWLDVIAAPLGGGRTFIPANNYRVPLIRTRAPIGHPMDACGHPLEVVLGFIGQGNADADIVVDAGCCQALIFLTSRKTFWAAARFLGVGRDTEHSR